MMFILDTLFELLLVAALIVGIIYEHKLVEFEQKVFSKRRKQK